LLSLQNKHTSQWQLPPSSPAAYTPQWVPSGTILNPPPRQSIQLPYSNNNSGDKRNNPSKIHSANVLPRRQENAQIPPEAIFRKITWPLAWSSSSHQKIPTEKTALASFPIVSAANS
jgi:hypothetical protein